MKCPNCNTENLSVRYFCAECGAILLVTCPECHTYNEFGLTVCAGCGEALSAYLSTDEKIVRRRSLKLYMHPNEDDYLTFYDKIAAEGKKLSFAPSWHWPAFLVALPWLWYRKLYFWGFGLLIAAVVLEIITPGQYISLLFGLIPTISAKRIYVGHALRRINKVDGRKLPSAERESYLEHAGGVSIPGAVFGSILLIPGVYLGAAVE